MLVCAWAVVQMLRIGVRAEANTHVCACVSGGVQTCVKVYRALGYSTPFFWEGGLAQVFMLT